MAFVVAAEELALFLAFSDEKEQVAVVGLHVEDGDFDINTRLAQDLEELALAVSLDIERDGAGRAGAMSRTVGNLEPSANASELDVEQVRVHRGEDTSVQLRVRYLRADSLPDSLPD
ncbi:MAG TPA: hypothetical protein VN688_07910 [Gemmataceae bacterium]|nr:hypothetical protein [Gemmataceae bacterium]